jgi:hypothetical protein
MSAQWAEENLNTIRTLMERVSVYRRALAPVAITVGLLGLAAAGLAEAMGWAGEGRFAGYWLGVAAVALLAVLLLVRRQAMRDKEEIMSPPMRRVVQALAPMLLSGLGLGVLEVLAREHRDSVRLIALWMVLYGGALHAAGFFMQRGLRWLGLIFVFFGAIFLCLHELGYVPGLKDNAHWLMGWAFGANHLAYGLYLKLTAKPTDEE